MTRPDTEHNLLTVLLGGGIAALVLVGLLSFALLGRINVETIEPAPPSVSVIDAPVAQSEPLGELSKFIGIIEKPVFFADRRLPVVEMPDGEQMAQEPGPDQSVEVPPLKAKVAGIIITPDMKLAMVTDNDTKETLLLREGMAMAGDKSAWKIAAIRPRGVAFETETGKQQDLELEVETKALKAGARPAPRAAQAEAGQPAGEGQQPAETDAEAEARARAEEIRRRVAERRAQLRAEAERRAREQQNDGGR
ncbi:MAG: hypothetical protein RQ847_08240 [Wenzhouxiangellaceae bacterium]|nr:hypothetical protein [Wenzhouxiangellaceae bacterium]